MVKLKSEELVNAIINCSPDGFLAYDESGRITFVNEVIEQITGWSRSELLGQPMAKICLLPESLSISASSPDACKMPQVAMLVNRNGKKVTLKARQIAITKVSKDKKENSFAGYLIIFHTENPLDLNTDKVQVEFVSTVSHELRTPLTSIKGFADTLLKSWSKLAEEIKKKYIIIIKEQADRLTRLVEDLLAVSRLESQTYQLTVRALDLKKAIDKVCDSLSAKVVGHRVIKRLEKDLPSIWADSDRLEQILTNIIDNAIKYSPHDSRIIISVSTLTNEQKVKDKLKIEITDEGIGIKENDLGKIFTKFGRLDNPLTRQSQGTGLGLFITKSLVLALKGEIFVNSKPGETTFTVILPAVISNQAIPLSSTSSFEKGNEEKNQ